MARLELRRFEVALLLLSGLVLVSGATLFVTGISARELLFGALRVTNGSEIGKVVESNGMLKRKKLGATVFSEIKTQAPLFQQDLVITGVTDSAKLELHDGSLIELGPRTMVRLVNESRLTLSGIKRLTRIELVEGEVKGSAKPEALLVRAPGRTVALKREEWVRAQPEKLRPAPVSTPAPTPDSSATAAASAVPSPTPSLPKIPLIRLLEPEDGVRLVLPPGTRTPERSVRFVWSADVDELEFALFLTGGSGSREILIRPVRQKPGQGTLDLQLRESGEYEWQIRHSGRAWISRFSLSPDFESIRLLVPLVSGEKAADNRFVRGRSRRPFDVTLRWEPFPGASEYSVWMGLDQEPLERLRSTEQTFHRVENPKVMSRPFRYRVTADLPGNFTVGSKTDLFRFQVLAPIPTSPKDGIEVAASRLVSESGLLLTWEKRSFTQGYSVELARDAEFKKLFARSTTRENFHAVRSLPPGKYYWRVRVLTEAGAGPESFPSTFTIKP